MNGKKKGGCGGNARKTLRGLGAQQAPSIQQNAKNVLTNSKRFYKFKNK
jgi:hypothetical protein